MAPPPLEHLEQSPTTIQGFLSPLQWTSMPLSHLLLQHKPSCSSCLSKPLLSTWPNLHSAPGLPIFPLTAAICMTHLQHEELNWLPLPFFWIWAIMRESEVREGKLCLHNYTCGVAVSPCIPVQQVQWQQKLCRSITFAPRCGCRHTTGPGGKGWAQK